MKKKNIQAFKRLNMKKDDSFYYFYVCPICKKSRKLLKTTIVKKPEYLQKCVICCNEEKKKETLKNCDFKERYKKAQQTCLKKYGVDNPNKLNFVKGKKKHTFKEHFGDGECIREKQSQTMKKLFEEKKEEILEKRKLTCQEKYHQDSYTKTKEYKEKNNITWKNKSKEELKDINKKRKHTKLEKHGDENYNNRKKAKQTSLENYGAEIPQQLNSIKEKAKETCLTKYGTNCFSKSVKWKNFMENYKENNKEDIENSIKKGHETIKEKYGVENAFLIPFVKQNRRSRYFYDNLNFDSKPELAFYIYCKDQNLNIKRCTKAFEYDFKGKTHFYFPDFKIDEKYYEIKGSQFLNENGTWCNPFAHNLDNLYEAKHQCSLKNNVIILYEKEYQKYINYVEEKYGKNFLNQFKN